MASFVCDSFFHSPIPLFGHGASVVTYPARDFLVGFATLRERFGGSGRWYRDAAPLAAPEDTIHLTFGGSSVAAGTFYLNQRHDGRIETEAIAVDSLLGVVAEGIRRATPTVARRLVELANTDFLSNHTIRLNFKDAQVVIAGLRFIANEDDVQEVCSWAEDPLPGSFEVDTFALTTRQSLDATEYPFRAFPLPHCAGADPEDRRRPILVSGVGRHFFGRMSSRGTVRPSPLLFGSSTCRQSAIAASTFALQRSTGSRGEK